MRNFLAIVATVFFFGCSAPQDPLIQILPMANVVNINDNYTSFMREDLLAVMETYLVNGRTIPLLFEHGTTIHTGAAAGWVHDLRIEPDGLWGRARLTGLGKREICDHRWKWISPGIMIGRANPLDTWHPYDLLEASLTNRPAIRGMAQVGYPRGCTLFRLITPGEWW